MKLARKLLLLGGGATAAQLYSSRVLATAPIQYLKMNETSGTTSLDASGNGRTGTYVGVDLANVDSPFLPDKAPLFDGVNDDLNAYSASLSAAWDWDEGSVLIWARVFGASIWTDGSVHQLIRYRSDASATDDISLRKTSVNNQIELSRRANAGTKAITVTLVSPPTTWFSLMLSWSVAGDYLKAYMNGVQIGTTQTGIVTRGVAGLNSGETHIGSANTALDWNGYIAQYAAWNTAENAARIALGAP